MLINLDTKSQIDTSLILFLKSHVNYTEFNMLNSKSKICSYTLKKYEHLLQNHNFRRVHRTYMVNMEHVVAIYPAEVLLSNGTVVPVSRRRRNNS
ncbi:LytTR family transcriptional regulator [Lacihabitans sp. CCS-44]|uniref:LytR/AlgR family response regulator transcription factor n=1 Tax=Lacihabitans sp. CCS-44 TaxID=2487331 RepID=UPI0020CD0ACF|nr:LytTR family DNA-binding domain-containing protein [Lacihabitans sp. CCS-44]MCP9755710.1 LytTR family transcriptional regulator [Lacihabitans sp. CCS-44]